MLAADPGDPSPPAPYVFEIATSGDPHETRLVIAVDQLQVWDEANDALLDEIAIDCISEITIIGSADPDHLILDFGGGEFGVAIQFNGGDPTQLPGDQITLVGGATDLVEHRFIDASSGEIELSGDALNQLIRYTGLEPIVDNIDATDRIFTFTSLAATESITLSDDGVLGDDVNQIDSDQGESVVFLNPSNSITINAGIGADTVLVEALDSVTAFPQLIVNGDSGADDIRIHSLPSTISATINGGTESDTIRIGSASGLLDPVLGSVTVNGEDHGIAADTTLSVTAKTTTLTVSVATGDQLLIDDSGQLAANTYNLNATSVQRLGLPMIVYSTIESVEVFTGSNADTLTIANTASDARLIVNTNAGSDQVNVTTTGSASILILDSGPDADTVTMALTGPSSASQISTGIGDDDIVVSSTGMDSALEISSGSEIDIVTLVTTGTQAVTAVLLGDGDDIANVRGTGSMSFTDVMGEAANDTFNVASDANGNRVDTDGNPMGTLDNLLGELCLDGGANLALPETMASVTAKATVVTVTVPLGDQFNLSDEASVLNHQFSLNTDTLQRTGLSPIVYTAIETLIVETGSGDDLFTIVNTLSMTNTTVTTDGGNDRVRIDASGDNSILAVDTGVGNDSTDLITTGSNSVTQLNTRADEDVVLITTTGFQSGLAVSTGTESDIVTLIGSGTQSVTELRFAAGDDIANIRGTGDQSVTELFAGSDNDTINVSSDADGDQLDPSGNPAGNLDGLLGPLCIHGNGDAASPETVYMATAKGNTVTATIRRGDELNISDQSSATNNSYTLNPTQFQRLGTSVISFDETETLHLETGLADDTITIASTSQRTTTTLQSYSGQDALLIQSTGNFSILDVDTGIDHDNITLVNSGEDSVTHLSSADGQDAVDVIVSGSRSGLQIHTGTADDVVTLQSTGIDSVTAISLDQGNDIANIRRTAVGSTTELTAGTGNDTINVTSTANGSAIDPDGDLTGNLDGISGEICADGGEHTSPGNLVDSVSARQTDANLVVVTVMIAQGDSLNLSDAGSIDNNTYAITASTLLKSGAVAAALITYQAVETLVIETGSGNESVDVQSTASATALLLNTHSGAASIDVQSTGSDSLFSITTDLQNDSVSIAGTGARSLVSAETFAGTDSITIGSVGDRAGIRVETGADDDMVSIDPEVTTPTRTDNAVINIAAGTGEDRFEIREVYLRTVVDLAGNEDNDTFNLTADGADALGYLGRINNDPNSMAIDDAIAATRQLFIDGGDDGAATTSVIQGASVTPGPNPQPVEGPAVIVSVGDTINVIASTATNSLDLRYVITGPAAGVLATTSPSDPRATAGNEVFETNGVESIQIVSGSADDLMTVSSSVPLDILQTGQRLSFDGGNGTDKLEVMGTAGADLVTVGDLAGTTEPIEIAAVEFLRIAGGDGDDQLVNRTTVTSVIDGLSGSDLILGGAGRDLLTGGAGVDFLFARGGNDVLFTDQDLGDDSALITDDEIIDGGTESSIPTGDVCVQLGFDLIRNCEVVGDGGGRKDTLTWLRGIFVPPGSIGFQPLSPVLDPFVPAFPDPATLLGVTEPSKLPLVVPPPPPPGAESADEFLGELTEYSWLESIDQVMNQADPMDANRDGRISPLDALYVINRLAISIPTADSRLGWETRRSNLMADVNRNGSIESRDALQVINYIATASARPQDQSLRPSDSKVLAADSRELAFNDLFADRDDDPDRPEETLLVENLLF